MKTLISMISVIDFIEWIVFPASFIIFILMLRRTWKARSSDLIEESTETEE